MSGYAFGLRVATTPTARTHASARPHACADGAFAERQIGIATWAALASTRRSNRSCRPGWSRSSSAIRLPRTMNSSVIFGISGAAPSAVLSNISSPRLSAPRGKADTTFARSASHIRPYENTKFPILSRLSADHAKPNVSLTGNQARRAAQPVGSTPFLIHHLSRTGFVAPTKVAWRERGLASPTGRAPTLAKPHADLGAVQRGGLQQTRRGLTVLPRHGAQVSRHTGVLNRLADIHPNPLSPVGMSRAAESVTSQTGAIVQ